MGKKLYVGNLGYGVTSAELEQMFTAHGTVQSAEVIMDRDDWPEQGFRIRGNGLGSGSTGGDCRP